MGELATFYVLALALIAIGLLAFEKAHLTVIGIGLVLAVALPGLIAPTEAVAGFANVAVVTVACMYVVGEGLLRTGAASVMAEKILVRSGGREATTVFLLMAMAAVMSGFVNNTLVVVTFLPVVTGICQTTGMLPSRLLIPLSYASILGGMCTLVGTSTNLLVDGVLEKMGHEGLSMFEMTGPAVLIAGVGLLYCGLVGRHLLPRIPTLTSQFGAQSQREYVTEITIGRRSELVGRPLETMRKQALVTDKGVARPLMLVRNEALHWPPFGNMKAKAGDILLASGRVQDLTDLLQDHEHEEGGERYDPATMTFFELALTPSSSLIGQRLGQAALKSRYGAAVVALQRGGRHIRERLGDMRLRIGDVLLVFGTDRSKELLRRSHEFHLIEGVEESIFRKEKAPLAIGSVLLVIGLFVAGMEPVLAAMIGALLMVLTGSLSMRQAHAAVEWPLLVFIGGTIALSNALSATGGTALIADAIQGAFGGFGPHALLVAIFVGSILLTEILSNNAVAVIMTPVAVELGRHAGIDFKPLVIAVALGASCSFANPMGYKTNLLILGPGGYRFSDYIRVGLPLDVLVGLTGTLALPLFFPL